MFTNLSIRRKVVFVVIIASALALGLAAAGLAFCELATFKEHAKLNLNALRDVLAVTLAEPEEWLDKRTVQETLESLKSSKEIARASYYYTNGKLFGQYTRNISSLNQSATLPPDGTYFQNGQIRLVETLKFSGQPVGRLELLSDLGTLQRNYHRYLIILAIVALILLCFSFASATILQRAIATPLQELATTAKKISDHNDFTLRAPVHGKDETGSVATSFNQMLAAIEKNGEALRRSETQFRSVWEHCTDGMRLTDSDGNILMINPAYCTMTGLKAEEMLNKPFTVSFHGGEENIELLQLYKAQFSTHTFPPHLERKVVFASGKTATLELVMTMIDLGNQDVLLTIYRDISQRKQADEIKLRLEMKLREAQKMEALGTLAGGIAHDFNNILGAIIGFTGLAQMENPNNANLQSHLTEVRQAANRAKDLIKRILTFSRQSRQEQKPILLYPVVLEVMKLLRSTLPATIRINTQIKEERAVVMADPTQIHQVIMNLATNAAFAMRDNPGILTITLDTITLDNLNAIVHTDLPAGTYLRLTVGDTGCGMDSETMKHIYEPFFTTKGQGEGTGLGLSVVHGIVKDHHGSIYVESEQGVGTTFQVFLPIINTVVDIPEESTVYELPKGHGEHILVVDDEPALCKMVNTLLENLGYRVTTYDNPVNALRQFKRDPHSFNAIITDFSMPELSGINLATEIRKIRKDIPIILTSGFIGAKTTELALSIGINEMATKPFSPEKLAMLTHRLFFKVEKQVPDSQPVVT